MTIYDRYYYDYYVDIQRYKYGFSKRIPHMFGFMIPKPDMVSILSARPEVLYERKQELTLDELKRQMNAYLDASAKIKNSVIFITEA